MSHLVTVFPPAGRLRRGLLSRDQTLLMLAAVNEIFLGVDTYLAHGANLTIRPNEWIPIIFGPVAGVCLLLAGLLALRRRSLAALLATGIFVASILVGVLGAVFHLEQGLLPDAPSGHRVSIGLLVWAPPVLGPMVFALIGILGISAAWVEEPTESGLLRVFGRRLQLPYPKTQAYFYIVGMASLATVISSVLDHARLDFANPWLWLPTSAGVFGTVTTVTLAAIDRPTRARCSCSSWWGNRRDPACPSQFDGRGCCGGGALSAGRTRSRPSAVCQRRLAWFARLARSG